MTKFLPDNLTTLALLVAIVLSTSRADATLLSDLMVTHASIQQGDALFSNIVGIPNFIGADPSNVDVQGESINGQDGLNFVFVGNAIDPTFQFLASTVVGGTHERAIEVDFDVTSTNPQFLLHGITQSATGTTSQISPGTGFYLSATQAFVLPNPVTVLALSVTSPPQPFNSNGSNTGLLPADQPTLHVWRQVQVLAGQLRGAGEGTAELTSFDVVFSLGPNPFLPGDYNGNGIVDAADYTVWRDTLGQAGSGLAADGDGSGVIDAGDYTVWKSNFGNHFGSGSGAGASAAVPEPATLVMLMLAAAGWCLRRRRAA